MESVSKVAIGILDLFEMPKAQKKKVLVIDTEGECMVSYLS